MNDKNAPKGPQFEDSILEVLGWNSPANFEQNQVIPFGPYLKDTDDLSSRDYETTQKVSIQDLRRVLLTLLIIFVVVPVVMLIVIVRAMRH